MSTETAEGPAGGGGADVTRDEQLAWERKWAPAAAAAAFGSVLCFFISIGLAGSAQGSADETDELLRNIDDSEAAALASSVVGALELILAAAALAYLYRAAKFRAPRLPRVAVIAAVLGALLAGGLGVAAQIELLDVADRFVQTVPENTPSDRAEDLADDIAEDSSIDGLRTAQLVARLGVGFGFLLISLWAMRAGLLSRFMGILGIILGVFFALGLPPLILIFYMAALALLFLRRWPGGRGPAWESAQADPWPSAADMRARMEAEREGELPPASAEPEALDPDTPQNERRRRKRKKRR